MDFLDLIITIAILAVGGLLGGKNVKKTDRRQQPAGAPRPVFETQPEMIFGDDDEVESASEWVEEPLNDEGVFGNPYFSYDDQPAQQWKAEPVSEPVAVETTEPVAEDKKTDTLLSLLGEPFDLRKAFVYQTILERVEC